MKCDKIIQSFLNGESIYPSLLIRLHTVLCSKCREEIRTMQGIFWSARRTSPFAMPEDLSSMVMARVLIKPDAAYEKNVPSLKWLSTGVIIFASIFMIYYSESFIWLKLHFGRDLEIPLNIVLGLVITFYAASYIGTHLEGVKRVIAFINHKIH